MLIAQKVVSSPNLFYVPTNAPLHVTVPLSAPVQTAPHPALLPPQRNFKYSRALLCRLIASELLPSDPPAFVCGPHLPLISQLAGNASTSVVQPPSTGERQ